MGFKDTYEAYINLSRRELQALCKKHNLPANKCQSDLARSLASFFKKKNSSLVHTEEASSVLAEGKFQDNTSDDDHDENGNQHNKKQDAKVGNELIPGSPIFIESSEEAINAEEATVDIIDNLNSSTSDVLLTDQNLMAHSPTKSEEQGLPPEPSSDNINLKSESPTICQIQAPPSQCTYNDKSTIRLATESCTVTETTTRPASFQFFVASEEGINLFIDLSSTPTDWVQSLKDRTWTNAVPKSCLISSLTKGANSSLTSVLSENFRSESVPVASIHNSSEIPIGIESRSGHTQEEEEENTKMEFTGKIEGYSKEACEISVTEPDPLVPCWSGDKLAGEETDFLTEELSVLGPPDNAAILDPVTGDGLLSSSDALDDNSVPRESDNAGSTPEKNLKRALDEVSVELSQNKSHLVAAEEGNKGRNFTKILRSSRTSVEEAQENNVSMKPRRSPRLVSK